MFTVFSKARGHFVLCLFNQYEYQFHNMHIVFLQGILQADNNKRLEA